MKYKTVQQQYIVHQKFFQLRFVEQNQHSLKIVLYSDIINVYLTHCIHRIKSPIRRYWN